jgi:Mitochondrial carrier protein
MAHPAVQLVMNVPFTAVHFSAYETAKRLLAAHNDDEGLRVQLLAGGASGGLSAAVTNPLDVLKTRLQTEGMLSHRRHLKSGAIVRLRLVGRQPCSVSLRMWQPPQFGLRCALQPITVQIGTLPSRITPSIVESYHSLHRWRYSTTTSCQLGRVC